MNRLREIREKRQLTQEQLALLSGVSRPTICKIESGKDSDVKIKTFQAIASALHLSVIDIILLK